MAVAPPSSDDSSSPRLSAPTTVSTAPPTNCWNIRHGSPGSEEYLDSEKYQIRQWNLEDPDSLAELIGRINRIRRDNPAFHRNDGLRFHHSDNEQLLCYSKRTEDRGNVFLMVVNMDHHFTQSGFIELDLEELGIDPQHQYEAHDLLTGSRYLWQGARNYVELNPHVIPAHLFRLRRRVLSEQDFPYYT